jgi:uncharacterized protein
MPVTEAATRIVVYLSEDDRIGHRGVHEAIMQRAREEGMAGASVWRGVEGFGGSGKVRTSRFPDAAVGLPLALELVDLPDKVELFLEIVHELAPGCLVTREAVEMTRFSADALPSLDDPVPQTGR